LAVTLHILQVDTRLIAKYKLTLAPLTEKVGNK